MSKPRTVWIGLGIVAALGLLGFRAWILSLPPAAAVAAAPPIGSEEVEATLAALKPPKRQRPVIAIIGGQTPAQALNDALHGIDSRYGARTRDVVAMQLEYPRQVN